MVGWSRTSWRSRRLLAQNLAKAKQLVAELPEEITAAATRKEEHNQTVASDSSGQ